MFIGFFLVKGLPARLIMYVLMSALFIALTSFHSSEKEKVMTNKMKVEIWSDVMCPFCYIGKRRFEKAMAQSDYGDQIEVVWKSFQLNPNQVTNPDISVTEDLAAKKGWSLDYTRQMSQYVTDMAAGEGLRYDFDNAVVANSFNAHRLLQFAKTVDKGDELKEALLRGYFTEGKNTDDDSTLIAVGTSVGLDANEVKRVVTNKTLYADAVNADVAEAQQLGIKGVPFFVVNRKYGISGAQEVATFSQTLEKAFVEWQEDQPKLQMQNADGAVCTPEGKCD
jgi:predicted DsbA family dithiol-disulfide isomerase